MRRPLSLAFDTELSSLIVLAAAELSRPSSFMGFAILGVCDPRNRRNLYGLLLELLEKFDEAQ
jgi:hypothetical protein